MSCVPIPPQLAVDTRTAARMTSLSPRTLWALTAPRGPIPAAKVGTRVLYRVVDLDAWLAAQAHKGGITNA